MGGQHLSESPLITRRNALKTLASAGILLAPGCTQTETNGDQQALSGEINIAGSSTVFPLMSAIAEEFQKEYQQVRINISQTGTGSGFANHFCPGNTDFNNASRRISDSEREICSDNGVEFVQLRAATDAITVIVSNNNDFVDCLTTDELAQIWRGDAAQTWQEVRDDWPDEPIERYGPADTSGTYDYFIEHIQGSDAGHTDDYQATEQDNTIVQGVQGNQYGIGYFGFAFYYQNPDTVQAVGVDSGNGCVVPSLETAAADEYQPLSRPLFTYCSKQSLSEEHIAEFARYFLEQSTNEDLVAGDVGYVPNSEETKEAQLEDLNEAISAAQS